MDQDLHLFHEEWHPILIFPEWPFLVLAVHPWCGSGLLNIHHCINYYLKVKCSLCYLKIVINYIFISENSLKKQQQKNIESVTTSLTQPNCSLVIQGFFRRKRNPQRRPSSPPWPSDGYWSYISFSSFLPNRPTGLIQSLKPNVRQMSPRHDIKKNI